MPTKCKSSQLEFEGFARRCVIADFQGGPMTSDAGTLLLRHTDRAIGLIDRVAACFVDDRMPELVEHQLPSMVGQRIVGVALGYEDINDHDDLRHDPVLALLSDRLEPRRKDCAVLAGKGTLNRLEHAPSGIRNFFSSVDHAWMERMLAHRIADPWIMRLIRLWLRAGVMDDGVHTETLEGTQQGAGISPLLANVYCRGEPSSTGRGKAGDVRFSGFHSLRGQDPKGTLHGAAEDAEEAADP